MDRREFFTATRRSAPTSTAQPPRTLSGIDAYTGPWTEQEVVHLLKRTMFGAKRADVNYFKNLSMSQAVQELLNPTAPDPAPPVKEYVTSTTLGVNADANILQGTTWINDINNDGTVQSQRRASYKKWWTGVMINQDRSIREKLMLFLIDHFGNETTDIGVTNWTYRQHALIRQYALGNFKELVRNITKDLSMLRYLNGYLNNASAPDENYARELFELFTLGKGPDSQYTEADVKEAAKVLTGWQINFTTWQTIFTASRHSTANKTFSPFFNNTVITGRTGATAGDLELADLLNMVFSQGEVAKFIVRKLYRWFVYYTIDDNTEQQVIAPLATIFRNNNYELKPVLTALFQSQHFYDVLNRGCVIKNPADQVIGSIRELNTSFPTATDYLSNYSMWNLMSNWMTNMGMSLNDPPNVSGMPAYYQEPLFHEIWINADSLPKRNQFTDTMIATGYLVNGIRLKFDCVALAQTFLNPGNPNDLIDEAVDRFFRNPLSVNSKAQIKTQILLTGQQWDYYWTNAWMAYTANPTTANFNTVNSRLMNLFKYLFNLAEYQLI
ncbi:MAG: hypothetical protein RIQ34_1215 [Bacteroidota bacterium]|jgi:uncharacterized protein (DUF1800 family)